VVSLSALNSNGDGVEEGRGKRGEGGGRGGSFQNPVNLRGIEKSKVLTAQSVPSEKV
jgi:hypothetical protein